MIDLHEPTKSGNWMAEAHHRLALRRAEKPVTKAGQIRALWPEIEAALAGGQSMKSIRKWLEEDAGINVALTSLTSYISRLRKRQDGPPQVRLPTPQRLPQPFRETPPKPVQPVEIKPGDPLAPAMLALSKRRLDIRELHDDGDPDLKDLI